MVERQKSPRNVAENWKSKTKSAENWKKGSLLEKAIFNTVCWNKAAEGGLGWVLDSST